MTKMTSERNPSYAEISRKFFQMEDDLDLFNKVIDDTYFWERVRVKVFGKLLRSLGVTGKAHTRLNNNFSSKIRYIWRATRNIFKRNPFLVSEHDLLFYGHPRRKKRGDGKWWDIYSDPVIESINPDYVYFESPYLGEHLEPAKTTNLNYLDLVDFLGTLRERLGFVASKINGEEKELISLIDDDIQERFSIQIDIKKIVRDVINGRKQIIPVYKKILKKINPELVFVVVSYSKENFIEACHDLGIPVVELQHGVIHKFHMGYSFPGKSTKKNFPDYFLSFGDFWGGAAELPISDSKIFPVGYPYLEEEKEKYSPLEDENQILFISQGTVGRELSKFAVELSKSDWIESMLVYKLHPGEFDRWKDEYPWLVNANIDVKKDEVPLYKLFAKSKAQIGVNSTALFEGQAFGLDTYLLDTNGIEIMKQFIEQGYAQSVKSVNDFYGKFESRIDSSRKKRSDSFFSPYKRNKINSLIENLKKGGSVRTGIKKV